MLLIVPSVTDTEAVSTLYKNMLPVAIPETKLRVVPVPKAVPATVGLVDGVADTLAPENVNSLFPVYPVARLLKAS